MDILLNILCIVIYAIVTISFYGNARTVTQEARD